MTKEEQIKSPSTLTAKLLFVCIVTTLGTSVPVGFHLGVINAPSDHMRAWCNETLISRYNAHLTTEELEVLWATVVSIFLIGGAVGSLGGAWIADRYGRKVPILIGITFSLTGVLFIIFCRMAESVEMLFIGRILIGFEAGMSTSTVIMYLIELAPLKYRGSIGTCLSLGISSGILIGQVCSLEEILGTENLWQYAITAHAVFKLICLCSFPWFPESPKFLYLVSGDKQKAVKSLTVLRGKENLFAIDEEIILLENEAKSQTKKRSLWSVLRDPTLLLPVVTVCLMQGGQQLSGINAIFFYSVIIFESAGLSKNDAKWANLGIGFINFAIVCCSPIIMAKFNRRPVILLSTLFSGIFLVLATIVIELIYLADWMSYLSIAVILGYIISFQCGLGPMPYFIASELFENGPKPAASSLGSFALWIGNFFTSMIYPILRLAWGAYAFLPFACVCFGLMVFLKFYFPETRGRIPSEVSPLVSQGFRSKPLLNNNRQRS